MNLLVTDPMHINMQVSTGYIGLLKSCGIYKQPIDIGKKMEAAFA